jgi:hypothetical protein
MMGFFMTNKLAQEDCYYSSKIGGFTMALTQTVQQLKNFIDGQWVEYASKQIEEVPNPATGLYTDFHWGRLCLYPPQGVLV